MNVVFTEKQIAAGVEQVAKKIAYRFDRNIVLVGVMDGCIPFLVDLGYYLRPLVGEDNYSYAAMKVSSYGVSQDRQETVFSYAPPRRSLAGRNVVIVDDICDTGETLKVAVNYVLRCSPEDVITVVAVDKPAGRRVDVKPNAWALRYDGSGFLAGYGMDNDGDSRFSPHIFEV